MDGAASWHLAPVAVHALATAALLQRASTEGLACFACQVLNGLEALVLTKSGAGIAGCRTNWSKVVDCRASTDEPIAAGWDE